MGAQVQARLKSYIQPFERVLALDELLTVAAIEADSVTWSGDGACASFTTRMPVNRLAGALTYWERVETPEIQLLTEQVKRELTSSVIKNGVSLEDLKTLVPVSDSCSMLLKRRCLRYGSHGMHEYRGKFFPQLVSSLLNASGKAGDAMVLDPMCGSGTTVVEAVSRGFRAHGIDMNPLSVFMARVKSGVLSIEPERLWADYEWLRRRLVDPASTCRSEDYLANLADSNSGYLREWFREDILWDLDRIACVVGELEDSRCRDFFRLCLSNILRRVSWQKTDDLRVRRDFSVDEDADPIREFLAEAGRSVRLIVAYLMQSGTVEPGMATVHEGDARSIGALPPHLVGAVDVVLTSPPYATALPYLDTDRLSLAFLNLLPREDYRGREREMIGNREVTERLRAEYWQRFEAEKQVLPLSVVELIERIELLNAGTGVGFRRRNLPALLAKYFWDMSLVLQSMRQVLSRDGVAFFVVGSNHTIAGGQRIDIDTPRLLSDVAQSHGFALDRSLPMEMLVSRDIHRHNASDSERILTLRPQ